MLRRDGRADIDSKSQRKTGWARWTFLNDMAHSSSRAKGIGRSKNTSDECYIEKVCEVSQNIRASFSSQPLFISTIGLDSKEVKKKVLFKGENI